MKKLGIGLLPMLCVIFITGSIMYADPATQDSVIRYYSVPPAAFIAYPDFQFQWTEHEFVTTIIPNVEVIAPIYLPDSARVIEFKVWVFDSVSTRDITASLYRTLLSYGSPELMAQVTSSGTIGNQELTDTTINYSIIDNSTYKYSVDADAYENIALEITLLYGMRIKYKVKTELIGVSDSESTVNTSHPYSVNSYPTPFSKVTTIQYGVQKRGDVVIEIYDEAGRLVKTLVDEIIPQGSYTARWDGKDSEGRNVAAGSYFSVVKTNGSSSTKVVHVK